MKSFSDSDIELINAKLIALTPSGGAIKFYDLFHELKGNVSITNIVDFKGELLKALHDGKFSGFSVVVTKGGNMFK